MKKPVKINETKYPVNKACNYYGDCEFCNQCNGNNTGSNNGSGNNGTWW